MERISERINMKKDKQKIKKGDYGYLQKNKLIQLTISLGLIIMVMIIFYTGYIKYGNTKNIFTVLAVVSVIPMAKFIVGYLVIAKYKSLSQTEYEDLTSNIGQDMLYDLIISSTNKVYNAKVSIVKDNSVYLYMSDKKYNKNDIEKYVRTFLETECKVTSVKVFNELSEFKKMAGKLEKNETGKYDDRIRKLLLIYSL